MRRATRRSLSFFSPDQLWNVYAAIRVDTFRQYTESHGEGAEVPSDIDHPLARANDRKALNV